MIDRLFRQMSATQILSAVSITLCLLIDSIVIGRLLGVESMSAYGLASPLLIVLTSLGTMCAVGVQVVCGRSIGTGDREGSDVCYSTSVAMALGMALLGLLLVVTMWKPLCTLLGAGEALPENRLFYLTGDYLRGYILGAPVFFLSQIMAPYLQIGGKRKLLMWSVAAMTATDIAADLVSVYVFHAGMFGIGLASSLSYLAAVLVGIGFFLKKDCPFRFRVKGLRGQTAWEISKAGSPVIINQICLTLRVYLINRILLVLSGTDGVAVYASVTSLGNLFFNVGLGTGTVALTLSSIFFSEEDRTSLCELVRVMLRQTLTLMLAAVTLAVLSAPWLARLFLGSAPNIVSLSVPALRLYCISLLPGAVSTTFKSYYQGTRRIGLTHLISVSNSLAFTVLFAWIGGRLYGFTGLWVGIIVGQLGVCVMILLIAWIRHGGISVSAETLSMLDQSFGARGEEFFDGAIPDLNTAVAVSERIQAFCRDRGIDPRTSYFIALCVEEMTTNIILHGFTKDKRPHNIDVRLVVRDTGRLIRIRDNCIRFDPTTYLDLHRTDDPAAHIGIRMVMATVTEANYIHTLGLNNLTLRL